MTMIRLVAVLPAVVAAALGSAGVSSASPDGPADASCTFTLSPPQRVQVSGADMVTATVTPLPCTGSIVPNVSVACVNMQGSGTPGQCVTRNGYGEAQVYFMPYRPGATYVSTGQGCGSLFVPPNVKCYDLGPYTATL